MWVEVISLVLGAAGAAMAPAGYLGQRRRTRLTRLQDELRSLVPSLRRWSDGQVLEQGDEASEQLQDRVEVLRDLGRRLPAHYRREVLDVYVDGLERILGHAVAGDPNHDEVAWIEKLETQRKTSADLLPVVEQRMRLMRAKYGPV